MKTIRGRLLAMLLTGLAVLLLAGGAAVYWIAHASLMRQFDDALLSRAQSLVAIVKLAPDELEFETDELPAGMVAETFFELRTNAGELLQRSDSLGEQSLPTRKPREQEFVFGKTTLSQDRKSLNTRTVWIAFRPFVDPEDWEEEGMELPPDPEVHVIAAALDLGPTDRALATLMTALIIAGGVVGASMAMLIPLGVRFGLRPLDRLRGQLADVSGRTISRRLEDASAPRELRPVYQELNGMLERIQRTIERERSFADAAAHELRTPLAELRTTAEVAIRWPDPGRAAAALTEALAIGREMERLVESLLLISRGNAGGANGVGGETAVAPIVRECVARSADAIRTKDLQLTVNLDDRGTLRVQAGGREAVEIIVRNLIDNAVQYTSPQGSIAIRDGQTSNGSTSLIVENGPVQLKPDDVPHLFEPFWRLEKSRSDRRHAGLGLSVVEKMAGAVGLRVDAELMGDRLQIRVSAAG